MAPTIAATPRHSHLVRAAQSAGEAFACPTPDELPGRRLRTRMAGDGLVFWTAVSLIAAAVLAWAV